MELLLRKSDDVIVPRAVEHAIRRQHAPEHHEAKMEEARGYYRQLRDARRQELADLRKPDPTGPPQIKPTPAQAVRIEQHKAKKKQWAVVRRKKRRPVKWPSNKYPAEITGSEVGKAWERKDYPVVVTGSRDIGPKDRKRIRRDLSRTKLVRPHRKLIVHHGGASGADDAAGEWAWDKKVDQEWHPADWAKHGRAAGPIRNKRMLQHAKPKKVLAYPKGESKGTRNAIAEAKKQGYKVKVRELKPVEKAEISKWKGYAVGRARKRYNRLRRRRY